MKKWTLPKETSYLLNVTLLTIRTHSVSKLLNDSTFRTAGPILTKFGMGGITFHRNYIVLSKRLCESDFPVLQAKIIFHELVHVAQQRDWGWTRFMAQYLWEWVSSGFSYKRMKSKSIEREAYALAGNFLMYT